MSTTQTDSYATVPPEIRLARNVIAGLAVTAKKIVDQRLVNVAAGEEVTGDLRPELARVVGLAAAAEFSEADWTAVLAENQTPELTGRLAPHQAWARDHYANNAVLARITACLLQTCSVTPQQMTLLILPAAGIDPVALCPGDLKRLRKTIRRIIPACAVAGLGYYPGVWNAMLASAESPYSQPREELAWELRLKRPVPEVGRVAAFVEYTIYCWRFAPQTVYQSFVQRGQAMADATAAKLRQQAGDG